MPSLSLVVITHNEERNIARCLTSVQGVVDDIVVVDSFSTDGTKQICEAFGVRFIEHSWLGYSATKNLANSKAKHDWILSLDADEALNEELRASILEIKKGTTMPRCSFNRLTQYCGKWIYHSGWYPDTKLRIFNRRGTEWRGAIHEELVHATEEPIVHLKGDCHHYSYYSVGQHLKQTEKFTDLSAQDLFSKGKKPTFVKLHLSPVATFLRNYVLKLGFLDGKEGFTIAKISDLSVKLKYQKLQRMQTR